MAGCGVRNRGDGRAPDRRRGRTCVGGTSQAILHHRAGGPDVTRQVLRSRARKQASTMLAELETMWPGASDQLTVNAVDAIGSWDQVAVRLVPDSETDAGCSVAGAYIAEMTPPVVAIAVAASAGRRAFTALHELGHHLQQTRKALYEPLLVDADDGGTALEDAACDAFAAGLLLPD